MRVRTLCVLALCLGLGAAVSLCPRAGQAETLPDTVKAESIRRMLLAPGGWMLSFPAHPPDYLTRDAQLTFELRRPTLIVHITILALNMTCEREVSVTAEGIAFDGCAESGITLRWTPDDPAFAFRGQNAARWYTLRPNRPN
ncbi:MAG: hypothetical protein MUC89_01080 [Acetobacteraceae bacterium]|jgi:hypothetical protein|nr:hypothetical protein [Acetobacteraceae bacterium]